MKRVSVCAGLSSPGIPSPVQNPHSAYKGRRRREYCSVAQSAANDISRTMKSITRIAVVVSWLFTNVANCRPADTLGPVSINHDLDAATCDSNPSWTARSFLKEDCYVSVLDMFLQDYRLHPQTKFEFYSSLYPAPTGSNRIQTPKRYMTSK